MGKDVSEHSSLVVFIACMALVTSTIMMVIEEMTPETHFDTRFQNVLKAVTCDSGLVSANMTASVVKMESAYGLLFEPEETL